MATSFAPPLPPDVVRQQQQAVPPAVRFMQNAGAMQAMEPEVDPSALIKDRMTQVVTLLKEVSNLVTNFKPAAAPYLQMVAKAGSEFMRKIEEGDQPSPPSSMQQAQMPSAPDQAGAVSMG